ncbi:hypothetical protein Pst134EA_023144 [Puccinia striiformis f. sp. tritici]|uniref:hypothetical protein n=1 Tax=Puccinia striiformis f. sp. tritici TaxID=168172 RepID=UPI002008D4E6|nr:hypothetical protein Pst134EA_023144 [Puccinia striiformis f. sp. tritici]KAH9446147.1 hypothetical protein Pst134EB_023963 [Puccinia striiformis f. sp. tritici]KAH9455686.1 hypothetical protein Pst134EA_023144 [Puccinia striiformis f. sp. tritici]
MSLTYLSALSYFTLPIYLSPPASLRTWFSLAHQNPPVSDANSRAQGISPHIDRVQRTSPDIYQAQTISAQRGR